MLGAPEIIRVNQILMHSIGAKNVLDVGLYTGFSALAAALFTFCYAQASGCVSRKRGLYTV